MSWWAAVLCGVLGSVASWDGGLLAEFSFSITNNYSVVRYDIESLLNRTSNIFDLEV